MGRVRVRLGYGVGGSCRVLGGGRIRVGVRIRVWG